MKKVLDTYSSKNDINIKQIVAYKDNILEIEEYKDGFKKDDTMNVMSVTKSVTSLLIGIAIDQGLIKSVDDYVMDYYKETYTPKRGEQTIFKVTIKHLLTMTAPYKRTLDKGLYIGWNQIVVAITAHFKPMVFDRVEYIEKNIVEIFLTTGHEV